MTFWSKFHFIKLEGVFDLTSICNANDNKLISFQFLTESNNIGLISTNGDINLVNVLNQTVKYFLFSYYT